MKSTLTESFINNFIDILSSQKLFATWAFVSDGRDLCQFIFSDAVDAQLMTGVDENKPLAEGNFFTIQDDLTVKGFDTILDAIKSIEGGYEKVVSFLMQWQNFILIVNMEH